MEHFRAHVLICAGTGCISSGSKKVEAALQEQLIKKGLEKEIKIVETGWGHWLLFILKVYFTFAYKKQMPLTLWKNIYTRGVLLNGYYLKKKVP